MNSPLWPGPADVPPEYALLVVDMKGYSRIPEAKMAPVRSDLDSILTNVFAYSGLDTPTAENGTYKDTGDGAIFVLPARDTARLIDPLLGNLSEALARYDTNERLASGPAIRLRASVHTGPLSLPDHRGDAINEACRLIDSRAVRQAMTAVLEHGSYLAAVVSEIAFRRTVRAGRTPILDERHFLPTTARVEGKSEFKEPCRLLVPTLSPVLLNPYIADVVDLRQPSDAAHTPVPAAGTTGQPTSEGRGSVFNFNAPMHDTTVADHIHHLRIDHRRR